MVESLRFQVLGPVRAWSGSAEVDLGSPMQRGLLAVLLLRRGHTMSRDEIIDALWGEYPPGGVTNVVHRYVAGLRRALEPDRPARTPSHTLVSTGGGYVLQLERGQVDLCVFEDRVARARGLRTADPSGALQAFDSGLELWRGMPLSGVAGPFVALERSRLAEIQLTAVEERIELMLALGRHAEVVAELGTLVRRHPVRERLRGLLMTALYRCDRQAEALEVYRDVRRILIEDMGIEPGRELSELHERILAADPALASPTTDRPPVPPHAGSVAVGSPRPAQLPHDVLNFTDREAELAKLHASLAPDQGGYAVRIVVIDGVAGVGKTALAVHFSHRVIERFDHGQFFVDLRGFDSSRPPLSAGDALGRLLHDLGAPPERVPADLDDRAAYYRSMLAGARSLIVLDNAVTADQVRPLLPASPGCLVVITSRNWLDSLVARDGAQRIGLGVLDERAAVRLLEAMVDERATAEPVAVAELARLCGYLPLALRVTAARVIARPHLTLADLVDELARERLDQLTSVDDESTGVRAAFSLSYRALPPPVARMFRLLGSYADTEIDVWTAASIASVDIAQARGLLDRLTYAHLLEEVAPERYQLHELLHLYASERAVAEEGGVSEHSEI